MGYGSCKLDMSHTLSTYAGFGNFYTTTVADNALISDLFIFTAMTFPVFAGSKDSLTEQTVSFRLQCSIVDRLGL